MTDTDERGQPLNQHENLGKTVDAEKRSNDVSSIVADPTSHQTKHSGADSKLSVVQLEAEVEVKRDSSKMQSPERSGNLSMRNGNGDSSSYEQDEQNKVRSELDSRTDELKCKNNELAAVRTESQKTIAKYEEMLRLAGQAADSMRREKESEVNALTEQLVTARKALEAINAHAANPPLPPSDLEAELRKLREQALKDSSTLSAAILEKDQMKELLKKNMETIEKHESGLDNANKAASTQRSELAEEVEMLKKTNKSLQGDLENQKHSQAAAELSLLTKIKDLMAEKSEHEESIADLKTQCQNHEKSSKDSQDISASTNETAKSEFENKYKLWLSEKAALEGQLAKEKERALASTASVKQEESWLAEKAALECELERANEQLQLVELESSDREVFVEMRITGIEIEKEAILESLNARDIEISKVRLEKKQLDEELQRLQDRLENSVTTLLNMQSSNSIKRSGSSEKESKNITKDLTLSLEEAVTGVQLTLDTTHKKLSETENKLRDSEKEKKGDVVDADHDSACLGQLLAETKIELAMQKCENEELQQTYRKLEKQTCALKLSIASMQEERDDMMAMKLHVDALLSKSTKVLLRR
jgi:hypothetical protein